MVLGTFLLASLAFAVDLTNMWFHRQAAQTVADAACQAGAMDMMFIASGTPPPAPGFTPGSGSDCGATPAATMCRYANFNGYSGTGLTATASNAVSWSFPASAPGATAPPGYSHPFLKVDVQENVQAWFMGLLGRHYQAVAATCTCGLVGIHTAAPMVVLDPSSSSSLQYSGATNITIVGGPQRSIQVNSSSMTAVQCYGSSLIDTNQAGPSGTGGDLAIFGGPAAVTNCGGAKEFQGGSTGSWISGSPPVPDPYGFVPEPGQPAKSITANGPVIVANPDDGCPDHAPIYYQQALPHGGCHEYEPGYYPSGLSVGADDVDIFKPGLYYFNGNLSIGGSDEIRVAKVCTPSCGPNSNMGSKWQQTDGVVFYFKHGQLNISGGSGALSSSRVDPVSASDLTCDGSGPPAQLAMPSTVNGNVLVGQCTANGYYYDAAGDTTDTRGTPGSRGILVFQGHNNPATSTTFSGAGSLAFSGVIYYHSTDSSSSFNVDGAAGTTSYMLGEIVADRLNLSGSGHISMALNSAATLTVLKAGMFN